MLPNFKNPNDALNRFDLTVAIISYKNRIGNVLTDIVLTGATAVPTTATINPVLSVPLAIAHV